MIHRNDPCWCQSGKKWKKCHYPDRGNLTVAEKYLHDYDIVLKTPDQIEGIRHSARCAASMLAKLCEAAKEGVTTQALDDLSMKLHKEAKARPAPLHYGHPPFPKSICTSLNEVICHGIPDDVPLKDGDILNIDVSCEINGFYGDCSAMVLIGNVSEEKRHVVDVSHESLRRSLEILKPGILVSDIGKVIEDYATEQNCSVVNQFVGHGIGLEFHEAPQVPHHYNDTHIPLVPGMTFTIEPMINIGRREAVIDRKDKWTARTIDGKPSAQWEHQVLITEEGAEILTLRPESL